MASGVGPDLALSEHGPCFVRGAVTLDDVSFTMKVAYISRVTLESDRHRTSLDWGTGSIVELLSASEGTVGNKVPHILPPHGTGEH